MNIIKYNNLIKLGQFYHTSDWGNKNDLTL